MSASIFDEYLSKVGGLPDPESDRQFYAGVPARRLLAFIIDWLVIWGAVIVLTALTFGVALLLFALFGFFIDLAYRTLTLAGRSATPGMRVMKIELRNGDGERFGLGDALIHTILFYVSIYSVFIHLISMILMLGSSMGRGLHDLPLGSAMINSPE